MEKVMKVLVVIMAVIMLLFGYIYFTGNLGYAAGKVETDARASQLVNETWDVSKAESDDMIAMIFYNADKTEHTFSIYVNRPGLSIGYFFREGGDVVENEIGVATYEFEGYADKAYISMNPDGISKAEYTDEDGETVTVDIGGEPFAIVASTGVTFYDAEGNEVA